MGYGLPHQNLHRRLEKKKLLLMLLDSQNEQTYQELIIVDKG
jgi:hypothetical protein